MVHKLLGIGIIKVCWLLQRGYDADGVPGPELYSSTRKDLIRSCLTARVVWLPVGYIARPTGPHADSIDVIAYSGEGGGGGCESSARSV